eukprot:14694898-Alexandrium_andersonii.AAC.1
MVGVRCFYYPPYAKKLLLLFTCRPLQVLGARCQGGHGADRRRFRHGREENTWDRPRRRNGRQI